MGLAAELKCPYCEAQLRGDCLSRELVSKEFRDAFGRAIRSHRIGNCPACWKVVEVVNGQVADTLLAPKSILHNATSGPAEPQDESE